MAIKFVEKIFGSHSQRELKMILPLVDKVESLRPQMQSLSDEELRGKTQEYKTRYANGESLDSLLPEAYATVREAAKRVLKYGALPGTAHRRCDPASGTYRRDDVPVKVRRWCPLFRLT